MAKYPAKAQTGATGPTGPEVAGAQDRDMRHHNSAAPEEWEGHTRDDHREILETLEEERQRAVRINSRLREEVRARERSNRAGTSMMDQQT